MSNFRLQVIFKPYNLLTNVGSQIYLLPKNSYLRILNSVEFVRVNSTNNQPLKIGQSFYLYFHFSQQYVFYDSAKRSLRLSKSISERTEFKILTDRFDWNSRGNIEMGMLFKYRIILAENSSRILNIENGQLVANSNQNQNSIVSFQKSIYSVDSVEYPIKLVSLEQNLTLCCKNNQACAQTRPSICQEMILLQKKQNNQSWAIRHVDSNSYLLKSGKQFIFLKDAPSQLKYCFRIHNYDTSGKYLYFQTSDHQYLGVNPLTKNCKLSSENLENVFMKNQCTEQSIKNILVSAWLKSEQPLSSSNDNILYMLQECQRNFQLFSEGYDENIVEGLITEGFFLDLQFISKKYPWQLVGTKIITILEMILRINKNSIADLFTTPKLYERLMKEDEFKNLAHQIKIGADGIKNPHKTLQDVQNLIFKERDISLASIQTLQIVMPLIQRHKNEEKHKQLKEFIQFSVQKIVPQVKKQHLSTFFLVGLKLVKQTSSINFFTNEIMKNLSLSLLESDKLSLKDKLSLIQIFYEQTPPYVYICCEGQEIKKRSHEKKNQKTVQLFIEECLSKNCRFESYEYKTIAISLLKYHLKINLNVQLNDCRQYVKAIIDSMSSYYYDERPIIFLKNCSQTFLQLINTTLVLCCKKSLEYDSLTSDKKVRTQKCKKQIQPFVNKQVFNFSLLWTQFADVHRLTIEEEEIFLLALKIFERVVYPQKYIRHLLDVIKIADSLSQNMIKIIKIFLSREHEFFPIETSSKIIGFLKGMQQDELTIIAHLLNENNMYSKITYKSDAFYKFINTVATLKIIQMNILNGQKLLDALKARKGLWLHNDSEFIFLKNLVNMIGGVVSVQIYEFFSKYLCSVQPSQWTLYYFRLCTNFFTMSPPGLKKKFVIKYHQELKSANQGLKLYKLFFDQGPQFTNYYITLLLEFVDFHSSKQLIYEIIGDETLFAIAQQFTGIQLRIKILNLMIKARKRASEFGNIFANPQNIFWLKKGTLLIRQKLGKLSIENDESAEKVNIIQISFMKDYSFAILEFLQMRQEIISKTEMSEDDLLVFEGTNKIFAFKVAELIGETVKNENIEKELLQKILWFENKYKISIDLVQLTQISLQIKQEQKNNENFQYKYMLVIKPETSQTADFLMTKIKIQVFIVTLINIVLSICFDNNPNWNNLEIALNYLHYSVTYKKFNFSEKQLELLFLGLRKLVRFKKLRHVAIIQNIIRKAIWNQGKLLHQNQEIMQGYVMKFKLECFDYLYEYINNYITFSPIYESTLNYFNSNGQQTICWSVSCYVSTLRFLICLSKSLKLDFKQIFSEAHANRKEFIGQIIEVNKKHISELFKSTSNAKLTIIAYEIQLINNLLRGPAIGNISIALKYNYQEIVSLISLPDLNEDPSRITTFNIIVYIKKLVVESVLILTPFQKFSNQHTRIIQDGLATYYGTTAKLVKDMKHIIQMYTQENKKKIQVMNFDLALNLFFCLMKIYESQNIKTIHQIRTDVLRTKKLDKSYSKKFKIFYQIYKIVAELLGWIGRTVYKCFKKTATEIDQAVHIFQFSEKSRQQKLKKAFLFFVKNVASIQVQLGQQLETIFFLLLKQTQCYNKSIRKELHRNVGLDERQFRLKKFMFQINHVILRLEVERKIKIFTQKYKPLEIIIKNRQLWKSMNFMCACVLNVIFLDQTNILHPQVPLYIVRSMSLVFSLFLLLIYFVQNLPLKRKLARKIATSKKPEKFKFLKSCLVIFHDKTLWFASLYLSVICLSFYQQGFVAVLMIDFFVRFKISKKVTQIITRPIIQLGVVVLVSIEFAYIFTCYQYSIHSSLQCPNISSCIQTTYIQYLGLRKNFQDSSDLDELRLRDLTQFFLTFLAIMINTSLIIGVLIYEKKKKDNNQKQWENKVKLRCFICDNERSTVDRTRNNNKGFYEHIEVEHNLWNYIYYLIYLKNKQVESLNVIQDMVLNQWKEEKFDWLPRKFNP